MLKTHRSLDRQSQNKTVAVSAAPDRKDLEHRLPAPLTIDRFIVCPHQQEPMERRLCDEGTGSTVHFCAKMRVSRDWGSDFARSRAAISRSRAG